jgi:hypothetical protein
MKRGFAFFAVLLVAALYAGSALARAGYIHDMTGSVTLRGGDQTPRAVKTGDLVYSGQTVATGERSSAVVKFEDGQVMVLPERSAFTVEKYMYNTQNVRESSASFRLLQGGLRFITGVIGSTNRDALRISAGTATIGIRGTDGVVIIDAITQAVTAAVNAGAVAMQTPAGNVNISSGSISSSAPGTPPTPPAPSAQAIGAVAQTLNSLAAAQNIPVNTPVVVQASARAAAAQAQAAELRARAAASPQDSGLQLQAQQATQQATDALGAAITAAQGAFQQAIQAGAVPPSPPVPPPGSSAPAPSSLSGPEGTATTAPASTTSTPSGTGSGGGGAGGGLASPN